MMSPLARPLPRSRLLRQMRVAGWLVLLGAIAACSVSNDYRESEGSPLGHPAVSSSDPEDYEDPYIGEPTTWGTGRASPPPGEFLDIAVGPGGACGVRADSMLVCWGDAGSGPPDGEDGYSAVRLAGHGSFWNRGYGCALRTDGRLLCWDDAARPVQVPGGAFVDAAVGNDYWCGHRADGKAVCGGLGVDGYVRLEGSSDGQVAVDHEDVGLDPMLCVLAAGGEARCRDLDWWRRGMSFEVSEGRSWGREAGLEALQGLLWGGDRWSVVSVSPYAVASEPPVPRLGGGVVSPLLRGPDDARSRLVAAEACGVDTDGRLECWGTHDSWTVPAGRFADVALGARHACALGVDGAAACWGANESGQTDAPEGPFSDIWAMDSGSCGLRVGGRLACWGDPGGGFDRAAGPFVEVAAGHLHACGLRDDGSVVCWPTLNEQTIAAGAAQLSEVDHRLDDLSEKHLGLADAGLFEPPAGPFSQIASGQFFACGLRAEGSMQCWGALGSTHGSGLDSPDSGRRFAQIAASGDVVCALDDNGIMGCEDHDCGFDADGSVQCNSAITVFSGPRDGRFARATALARLGLMCGIQRDRGIGCAGERLRLAPPTWVGPLNSIDVSRSYVCGTRISDGSVACWRRDGSDVTPTQWQTGAFLEVDDVCALRADNTISCLPDPLIVERRRSRGSEFVRHSGLGRPPGGKFTKVVVGASHACALRVDRAVICWGSNEHTN